MNGEKLKKDGDDKSTDNMLAKAKIKGRCKAMYDCIVAGAGPAGSAAATRLSKAGLKVLVLEKQTLPRYKACAGAVSGRAASMISIDLPQVTEDVIKQVNVDWASQDVAPIEYISETPIAYLVMRSEFDSLLAQQAATSGALIHDGEHVESLRLNAEDVEVKTNFSIYRARTAIGADGALGVMARQSDLHIPKSSGIALEIEAEVTGDQMDQWRSTALVSYGGPRHGYAWLFPKANHLSMGIGDLAPRPQNLVDKFRTFTDALNVTWRHQDLKAHPIPLAGITRCFCRPRLLLAGDAAGLCDPLSGEGIAYAIQSGLLAAETILKACTTGDFSMGDYQSAIETNINSQLKIARQLAALLYAFPGAFFRLFRTNTDTLAWYFDAVKGERNYGDVLDLVKATLKPQALFGRGQRPERGEISP